MAVLYADRNPRERELLMLAEFGITLEEAMKTPLWRFLSTRAEQEAQEAVNRLLETDPADALKVAGVQNDIRRHRELVKWMTDGIEAGREAGREVDEILRNRDESESAG